MRAFCQATNTAVALSKKAAPIQSLPVQPFPLRNRVPHLPAAVEVRERVRLPLRHPVRLSPEPLHFEGKSLDWPFADEDLRALQDLRLSSLPVDHGKLPLRVNEPAEQRAAFHPEL